MKNNSIPKNMNNVNNRSWRHHQCLLKIPTKRSHQHDLIMIIFIYLPMRNFLLDPHLPIGSSLMQHELNYSRVNPPHTHLPAGWAVAVSFVSEVRNCFHHPLVDLCQGQSLLRRVFDGLADQVCVALVPPRVAPGRAFAGSRSGSAHSAHDSALGRRRRFLGLGRDLLRLGLVLVGGWCPRGGLGAIRPLRFDSRDVGPRQWPRAGAGSALWLKIWVNRGHRWLLHGGPLNFHASRKMGSA